MCRCPECCAKREHYTFPDACDKARAMWVQSRVSRQVVQCAHCQRWVLT